MNIQHLPDGAGTRVLSLTEIYPPFAEKLRVYGAMLESDPDQAEKVFVEAQQIAQAFYAGQEFARGIR